MSDNIGKVRSDRGVVRYVRRYQYGRHFAVCAIVKLPNGQDVCSETRPHGTSDKQLLEDIRADLPVGWGLVTGE